MARYYDNAPIGNTCPDIDGMINIIESVADRLEEIAGRLVDATEADELETQAGNLRALFQGRQSPIEELRLANEKLRNWGNEEYRRAEDAESTCADLRKEISALEDQ